VKVEYVMDGGAATPEPDYTKAWDDLYLRRVIIIGLFLGFLPGVPFLCFVVSTVLLSSRLDKDTVCIPIALIWLGAIVVSGIRASFFRCPQCRQLFSIGIATSPFRTRCVNCGIKMGEHSNWPND
jgi:hypothetical protein